MDLVPPLFRAGGGLDRRLMLKHLGRNHLGMQKQLQLDLDRLQSAQLLHRAVGEAGGETQDPGALARWRAPDGLAHEARHGMPALRVVALVEDQHGDVARVQVPFFERLAEDLGGAGENSVRAQRLLPRDAVPMFHRLPAHLRHRLIAGALIPAILGLLPNQRLRRHSENSNLVGPLTPEIIDDPDGNQGLARSRRQGDDGVVADGVLHAHSLVIAQR
mmetsp:Transcript_1011/g.3222  ORF Transcript_1011/g.3222 Transcript_1011/m.3222 type:complete len:218 (-) Transcript_1011:250-903(-)